MMQKLERLIDVATEALTLYVSNNGGQAALPFRGDVPAQPSAPEKPAKERKTRTPKAAPEVVDSPFGGANQGGQPAPSKLAPEDAIEAGRRGQEVMGLFIRRYLKASPTGLERAKKIINDTLGLPRTPAAAWKLEDFTPEDWLKLTPTFEAELEKADGK
jgi:hypothetical protein